MSIGLLFWILFIISFVFSGWSFGWSGGPKVWGGSFLMFVLVGLLGWGTFGAPLHG